jgi:hypothetical protein
LTAIYFLSRLIYHFILKKQSFYFGLFVSKGGHFIYLFKEIFLRRLENFLGTGQGKREKKKRDGSRWLVDETRKLLDDGTDDICIKRKKKRAATRRDTPRNGWCTPYAAVRRIVPGSQPCRVTSPVGIRCEGFLLVECGCVAGGSRGAV